METLKNAIVTGASRGIGKAIAEEFASRGYNLGLISRNYEDVNKVAEEIIDKYDVRCIGFECGVADKEEVKRVFSDVYERFGGLDVLVNNAGVNSRKSLSFTDFDRWLNGLDDNLKGWEEELRTNLTGTYICSYVAAGYMLKQGKGSIINISSVKGIEPTSSVGYGASKAGVIKLTRDFAKALGAYGIRVNCIAPGFIDTGMTSELQEEKKAMYKALIPENRFGSVEEVAKAVAFLASDKASYINGETINVNGGYLMF